MSTRTRHRRSSRRSARPLVAAGILAGGLVLSFAFAGVTIQGNALARSIDELNVQIAQEQARRASLEQSAAEKRTADYVVEKAKQYGWVWPWEAIIAVQRDANARAQQPVRSDRPSRIERWVALFVGTR